MTSVSALPPGPRESPLRQLLRYVPHPAEFLEACRRDFGDRFTMRLAGFGTFVLLARPAAVQELFRGEPIRADHLPRPTYLDAVVAQRSPIAGAATSAASTP